MNLTKKTLLLTLIAIVAVFAFVITISKDSFREDTNKNLDEIINQIDNRQSVNALSSSSNPYDYIKNNPSYENIIKTGYTALPLLEQTLVNSTDNGLKEYIMCIAIEAITHCDLKQFQDSTWETSKDFQSKWNTYLKNISLRVDALYRDKNKSFNDKEKEIKKLGDPAILYWIDLNADLHDGTSKMASSLFKEIDKVKLNSLKAYIENR